MKQTECTQIEFEFQGLGRRRVVGEFDGGRITSDAGVVLLRELEASRGIVRRFAECFQDHRDQRYIEHTVQELIKQRVISLALGYEDLVDHDELRLDVMLATAVGKQDPTGSDRRREQDKGKALAGKSTLNRLELRTGERDRDGRYKKIEVKGEAVDRLLVELFIESHKEEAPKRIILDLDATDDPVHGNQEGRFFHGYYREYCYLPLYIFCGEYLLCARLREANKGESAGAVDELKRIVAQIRQHWPEVEIVIRGDSSFGTNDIMAWCEENKVGFVLGKAKNKRLEKAIEEEMDQARQEHERTGQAARVFKDFTYRTRKSWSRERRVIGKAEYLGKGPNPRFVVTSLSEEFDARQVYEEEYCGRGDMENRIKEQQLYLFADRTSASMMKANQLRLWFSSIAYVLMNEFRVRALAGTEMAKAQCDTIRLKLLKIGAVVRVSVRRILISFAESYPYQRLFQQVCQNLLRQQLCSEALRC